MYLSHAALAGLLVLFSADAVLYYAVRTFQGYREIRVIECLHSICDLF